MFSNQNKVVSSKFQNARDSAAGKPNPPKDTPTGVNFIPVRPTKLTLARKPHIDAKTKERQILETTKPVRGPPKPSAPGDILKSRSVGNYATFRKSNGANKFPEPYSSSSRIYRPSASKIFDYDLSHEEQRNFEQFPKPMKSVPASELELLRSGQRSTYLETRYERTPDAKYNYPEATSWRYGWFHRKPE